MPRDRAIAYTCMTVSAALITRTLALPAGGMSSLSFSTDSPRFADFPVPATVYAAPERASTVAEMTGGDAPSAPRSAGQEPEGPVDGDETDQAKVVYRPPDDDSGPDEPEP